MTQEVAEDINFWRKRQTFQWRKDFRLFLLVLWNKTNVWEKLTGVPQGNLTINVEVIRPILHDPRGCWKHNFLKKKAIFPVKKIWPTSSRIIVHDKLPATTYKGPQGNLTFNVEVKVSFLQDPRGCWRHKFLIKRQSLQWRKDYGLFLLVL